jgi:hypothetical protein
MSKGPTSQSYDSLAVAYDRYNRELFDGKLPQVLFSYQRGNYLGYASNRRWVSLGGEFVHEIAMNPSYFAGMSVESALSTLLHEATHVYQFEWGKPGRGRYHNKQFAEMMADVGLICSHDGLPGGKQTGDNMTHYIVYDGGAFRVIKAMVEEGFQIPWLDRVVGGGTPRDAVFDSDNCSREWDGTILGEPFSREEWERLRRDPHGGKSLNLAAGTPGSGKLLSADEVEGSKAGQKDNEADPVFFHEDKKKQKKTPSKLPYCCPGKGCKAKVWGKPGLLIGCFCDRNAGLFEPPEPIA